MNPLDRMSSVQYQQYSGEEQTMFNNKKFWILAPITAALAMTVTGCDNNNNDTHTINFGDKPFKVDGTVHIVHDIPVVNNCHFEIDFADNPSTPTPHHYWEVSDTNPREATYQGPNNDITVPPGYYVTVVNGGAVYKAGSQVTLIKDAPVGCSK